MFRKCAPTVNETCKPEVAGRPEPDDFHPIDRSEYASLFRKDLHTATTTMQVIRRDALPRMVGGAELQVA